MRLKNYSKHLLQLLLPSCIFLLSAQTSPQLAVTPPEQITVKRGATATVKVTATLSDGFHLNSHTPAEDFLIPLTLKWALGAVVPGEVAYPKPQMVKVPFQEKPLSVLTGKFELSTPFKVPADAPVGPTTVTGKLRYQACNDKSCFPPKTLDVKVPVEVQ
jgi:Thiol:disulfide interchange protein DsbD, N-terminal